jgi:acetyl esterase/lipase
MSKVLITLLLSCSLSWSSAQEVVQLWPAGKMPNSKGMQLADSISGGFLFTTTTPKLYAYPASASNNTGAAILLVPGGGYLRLPADYTNVATALYYQKMGINAFVLSHRLPASPDLLDAAVAPLQDAQRAMRIIYANASKWGIDTARIGVGGTSAGGHVASTLGTHLQDVSAIGDNLDTYSFQPKFMILVSPVISFKDDIVHKGSRDLLLRMDRSDEQVNAYSNENRVTKSTPPTLLIHGHDDKTVSPLNSVVFYQALKAASISASMHIFPFGGHSYTVNQNPGSADMWPTIAIEWLREMKFVLK